MGWRRVERRAAHQWLLRALDRTVARCGDAPGFPGTARGDCGGARTRPAAAPRLCGETRETRLGRRAAANPEAARGSARARGRGTCTARLARFARADRSRSGAEPFCGLGAALLRGTRQGQAGREMN